MSCTCYTIQPDDGSKTFKWMWISFVNTKDCKINPILATINLLDPINELLSINQSVPCVCNEIWATFERGKALKNWKFYQV